MVALVQKHEFMKDFYKGKRVLVTGHTGFKGSWLAIWLNEMGAEVVGYALEPNTDKDNYVLSGIGGVLTAVTVSSPTASEP